MRNLLLSVFCICMFVSFGAGQTKPKIAVMDFDYGAVSIRANSDIVKGIPDLLGSMLFNSGTVSVLERKNFDTILKERNISTSNDSSAKKIGELLGADAIVFGRITRFSLDDGQSRDNGGSIWSQILTGAAEGAAEGLGGKTVSRKAVVEINARIVSVTGEILSNITRKGESQYTSTNFKGTGGGSENMRSIEQTITREAVNAAVSNVASKLIDEVRSGKVTARVVKAVKIDGLVSYVQGNELTLNVSKSDGVKVGNILVVERITNEVTDPSTGEVIRRVGEKIGEVEITEVGEKYSVGNYSGSQPAERGDLVRN